MTKEEKEKRGYWVHKVTTDVVAVPKDSMKLPAKEMANLLLKINTYPGCHGSINRYLQYYLNRGGKGIPKERYEEIRKAQEIIRSRKPKK